MNLYLWVVVSFSSLFVLRYIHHKKFYWRILLILFLNPIYTADVSSPSYFKKTVRILNIDGGGERTIFPATILEGIE